MRYRWTATKNAIVGTVMTTPAAIEEVVHTDWQRLQLLRRDETKGGSTYHAAMTRSSVVESA